MPFDYYRRLSRSQQATYRKSDAIVAVRIPEPAALRSWIEGIAAGLAADDKRATGRACRGLVDGLCAQLGAARLIVRVLARRPTKAGSELHGLYERDVDTPAILRVWMRTSANEQPVALRTFVRTLLHEVCHHLDFELYGLVDTFHTQGFFRRESSLARQLLPPSERARGRGDKPRVGAPAAVAAPRRKVGRDQLELFKTSFDDRDAAR